VSSSTWVGSAYGLNFAGLDADRTLFGERRPDAPTVTIGWEASPATACAGLAGNDTADLQFLSGQRVRMDRVARTATYSGARIARDERVHPYLGQVAIVHSRWLGREAIHAGAFETAGAAWAVVGGRAEAEKGAELWRFMPKSFQKYVNNPDPREIQRQAEQEVPLDKVFQGWVVSEDPQAHIEGIQKLLDDGARQVFVHSPQEDQERFIEFYGREVLPKVRGR